MSIDVENTGELHLFAEAYDRIKHDPRQPGPLEFVLAAAALAAVFVVGICALILTFAPAEYPVDAGRVLLVMAAIGTITAPVMGGFWGVLRAQRRRHTAVMEKLDRIRCGCDPAPSRRPMPPSEYYKIYSDAIKDLGDIPPDE